MHRISKYSETLLKNKGIDLDKEFELIGKSTLTYSEAPIEIRNFFSEKAYNRLACNTVSTTKFASINKQIEDRTKTFAKKTEGFVMHVFAVLNNKIENIAIEVSYEEPIVELKYEISNIEMEKLAMVFIENKCDMQKTLEVAMTHAYIHGAQHGGMDSSIFNRALEAKSPIDDEKVSKFEVK